MRAIVDENICIGCGVCADACRDVFKIENGVAVVTKAVVPADAEKSCRVAKEACPVEAITLEE